MKILFDHQIFSLQNYGGISRYFFELMNRLQHDAEASFEFPIFFSHNSYLRKAAFSKHITFLPNVKFGFKRSVIKSFNSINLKRIRKALHRQDFDIFHPTYYEPYFLNDLKNKPFVLTIHDMIPELYPELFSPNDKTIGHKKLLIEKANRLVAASENTKKDMIKFYAIDPDRITTIYHGCPFEIEAINKIPNHLPLPERYILFVGKRKSYKNFRRFVDATGSLLKHDRSLNIVCAGGENFSHEELRYFEDLNIKSQVIYFPVNDDRLIELYRNAIVFVYPSLYEGFGFPILEAFACGCPVLVSDSSSFPEVAGDAGIYFDPYDVESIETQMSRALRDDDLRNQLREKGFEQMKRFPWDRTVSETKALYQSLI